MEDKFNKYAFMRHSYIGMSYFEPRWFWKEGNAVVRRPEGLQKAPHKSLRCG